MRQFLKTLFFNNWSRKLLAVAIAIIIWLLVNNSLTVSRTIDGVSVRVANLPAGKTVEGLNRQGTLAKHISITLFGKKSIIDDITPADIEVVVDAAGKGDEFLAHVSKKNIVSTQANLNFTKGITKVTAPDFNMILSEEVRAKIPVFLCQPIGEAPRDYQYLDIFPCRLYVDVKGPKHIVEQIRNTGKRLVFNLSKINKRELDALEASPDFLHGDVVSYYVDAAWKDIYIPELSDEPFELCDPKKNLRIDFIRSELRKIKAEVPVYLYFSPEYAASLNPETKIVPNDFIKEDNGIYTINKPLYAKGVSRTFLDVVQDRLEVLCIVTPHAKNRPLTWIVQFINPNALEEDFVSRHLSEEDDPELRHMIPEVRKEYLRDRFRSYMYRFRLYTEDNRKLRMKVTHEDQSVRIIEDKAKNK